MALSLVRNRDNDQSIAALTRDALGEAGAFIDDYIVFPTAEARDVVVLWTVHTHAIPFLDTSPRLAVSSSEPGSGKTLVLDVVAMLAPNATKGTNLTPAVLWRAMEAFDVTTIMLDEADTVFGRMGSGSRHVDLRAVINAGYVRGGTVLRPKGGHDGGIAYFDVFGPMALAGLGRLPDTILSRSIEIRMCPPTGDVRPRPFRVTHAQHEATEPADVLRRWSHVAGRYVAIAMPAMPDHIRGRAADVWEPLFKVAQLAGEEWQDRVRRACMTFTRGDANKHDAKSDLLRDVASVFDGERMFTHELLDALYSLPGSDWSPEVLTPRSLAAVLERYGAYPRTVRIGKQTAKGYVRADLRQAFDDIV